MDSQGPFQDGGGDNYWSSTSTQQFLRFIGTDLLFHFCQRLMIESMGMRMMARKGGQADILGN